MTQMPSIYAQLSKDFWLITKGEILQCVREMYNLNDTFVVAILKHGLQYTNMGYNILVTYLQEYSH